MTTKLTLNIDESLMKSAKKYAKKKGKSLSEIVTDYLELLAGGNDDPVQAYPTKIENEDITIVAENEMVYQKSVTDSVSPKALKLFGSISLEEDFDYKKELSKAINKKHQ